MAAEEPAFLAKKRYALVTGANKGIGLEICRQLASQGVVVVLTSRDEQRGAEAIENLKKSGIDSNSLEYHQLDVADPTSFTSLADFVKAKFGKLDILVNNAGISGVSVDYDALMSAIRNKSSPQINYDGVMTQTYEQTKQCLETNYYGVKRTIEALLPLLQLSDSPRIVNVSSDVGLLKKLPHERVRGILSNADNLTEEIVDGILNEFLGDFKEGVIAEKGWPTFKSAYSVSKACLNAYTRILASKYPSIIINCVCPGVVKTDINLKLGHLTVEEGAASPARYFFNYAKTKAAKNMIHGIKNDNGVWIYEEDLIMKEFHKHYEGLFQAKSKKVFPALLSDTDVSQLLNDKIDPCDVEMLTQPYSKEEIRSSVLAMGEDKSPGPDGITTEFIKENWNCVGADIVCAV